MYQFLQFVKNVAPLIYFLVGILIFFRLLVFFKCIRELQRAQFRLEREQCEEKGGRTITQIIVMLEIGLLTFFVSTTTYNAWHNVDSEEDVPSEPISSQFSTAIPQSGGEEFVVPTRAAEGITIPSTPMPSPTAAGTKLPADDPLGCRAKEANILRPANGQVIFEVEPIFGTANLSNFGYYRFEIRNVETGGDFGVIGGASSDFTTPVIDGPLGSIVPQNFIPGEYRFRMTVFNSSGTMQAVCEISIFISDPLPTPTPIGADVPASD